MRKLLLPIAVIFCVQFASGQKKMVIEKMRCISSLGPTMAYLKDPAIKKTIASQLNETLHSLGYPALADTNTINNIEFPVRINELNTGDISFTDNDTSHLHLYLDLYEATSSVYFNAYPQRLTDTTMYQRARSVFLFKASIFTYNKKQIFGEELNTVVSPAESNGMGILYNTRSGRLSLTQRGFTELFRSCTKLLFDPKNELAMIEMKASPAFVADDYILPKLVNKPRIAVMTNKTISRFIYNTKPEMIRLGDMVYEEIVLRGKKAQKYQDDFTKMIKSRERYDVSDFVFLRQECRDVLRDKNYLLKLSVQIDPGNMREEPFVFTNFLPLDFHYLFLENDTIAKFTVQTGIADDTKKIYPAIVSNGIDSSSFFTINVAQQPQTLRYEYVVQGVLNQKKFTIKCSGNRNTIKEIYVNDQLVCIAQGKFSPEKFVVFDASLSPELLNQLFMIGFNHFFE